MTSRPPPAGSIPGRSTTRCAALAAALAVTALVTPSPRAAADPAAPEPPPELQPISLEALLDIVVTATLREQSSIDAPASIVVVNAAQIRARSYRTLKAIMDDVPGFNDVSDVNEEIVAVRGAFASTTNKILILVNGHRMNDLMLGRYNVDQFLGMSAVDRVEFIRGPASALYGTGALVGIVNVITRKGADLSGFELGARAGLSAHELTMNWGRDLAGYDLFVNVTYLDSRGQEIDQPANLDVPPTGQTPAPGKIYVSRYPENISGLVTVRSEDAALTLRAAHFRRVPPRGARGAFYDYEQESFKPSYTENDFFIDYAQSFSLGNAGRTRLTVNPSVHFLSYFEQSFLTFGANRLPPYGQRGGMHGEFNDYQLRLTLQRQITDGLDLTAGLDGLLASFLRADAVRAFADQVLLTPEGYAQTGHWFLGGAFLQAVWSPHKTLSLTAGARYDTFQGEADAELTPRAGLVYRPHESLAMKLLYGRSYLAPMWGHKRANDGAFVGSPNLAPESFQGVNLIASYVAERSTATIDFFLNEIDGLINAVPGPNSAVDYSVQSYVNTGESLYYGVELSGETALRPWLHLSASYSHIRPIIARGHTSDTLLIGDRIKNIAHHTLRYGLRLDPLPSLSVNVWGRAYSETATADPVTLDETISPVALFDASVTYSWNKLVIQITGRNLTDRYTERGGTGPRPLAREQLEIEASLFLRF